MSKFKVNQEVILAETDQRGVIKAREAKKVDGKTIVKYMVDLGGGLESWKVCEKKDLKKPVDLSGTLSPYFTEVETLDDGKVITMVAKVDTFKEIDLHDDPEIFGFVKTKKKVLKIGFSLYNGTDEYDAEFGLKIAKHRCKSNPFTTMWSSFTGEFNPPTVYAIMDAKINYIKANIDMFYRPEKAFDAENGDPSVVLPK